MARSRNIKPGFFRNEELVELAFEVRLLFIGLWTLADRAGRLEDRPKRIKMAIFPADEIDIEAGLSALAGAGFITRYVKAGCAYIAIPTWGKHQNPHHREPESQIPAPDSEAEPVPKRAKPEESPGQALDKPEASPSLAVLIPDSRFLIPDSVTNVTRADAPSGDPQEFVFLHGLALLTQAGNDEAKSRRFLGKCCSVHGPQAVADAVTEAIRCKAGDPVPYLQRILSGQPRAGPKASSRSRNIAEELTDRSWAS